MKLYDNNCRFFTKLFTNTCYFCMSVCI